MNKLFTIFSKRSFFFLISALFTSVTFAQSFSPTVSVSLSNLDCGFSSDLSIDVSQNQGETDVDASLFTSDLGSFLLSSLSVGDTVGSATMNFNSGSSVQSDLIVGATSNISTVVLSVDAGNGTTLGSFTMSNSSNGGVVITATSPGDGNSTTGGYSSNVTFLNLFSNPNSGVLNFTSTINSELGESDSQSFTYYLSCLDFSPTVSVSLSNNSCDSLADLTINVSQDAGEADIASAVFTSDGGQFLISSMSAGDVIGTASMTAGSNSYNADLVVGTIVSSSQVIIQAIDNTSGLSLGTFNIENSSNGTNITATSPSDGNSTTSVNSSVATFNNVFQNPINGALTFTSTLTSELGGVDIQSSIFMMTCSDFSPSVSVLLSNSLCDSLSDLTINVSQDANEIDMDTALFSSNGGLFTISSMSIADNVGTATMTYGGSISLSTDLFVSSLISSNEAIIEAIDLGSGLSLGTFLIENLLSGGVNVVATSPADGNSITNGNTSSITFNNIFQNPSNQLNFTSSITSELGDLDTQLFSFNMNCVTFSPTGFIALLTLDCDSLNDLTINVSQDPYEVDMDTALLVSDGGSFTISSMSVGDTIGSASLTAGTNAFTTDLLVSSVVSSSQVVVESIDVNSGLLLGTFLISNNLSGGVSITATSPADGNNITLTGNTSLVTFNNVFLNPTASTLNFVSTITSELGDVDIQNFSFLIVCQCVTQYTDVIITSCDNFTWDGIVYDSSGSYTNTYLDLLGCDSIVTLNLTINNSSTGSLDITACDDFTWDGVVYDSTGSYTNFYTGLNGCDSTFTLNLIINNSSSLDVNINQCDSSFFWDGVVYDSTGSYTNVYTGLNGCDSTVTLNLTINYSYSGSVDITACDNFTWDGVVYDSTGSYTNAYTGLNGCDSTVTLNLIINNSFSSSLDFTACDDFTWDGVVYDSTGSYTNVYTGLNGCDSTVTLNLTINNSYSGSVDITACDDFTWDGVVYDLTGTYTNLYTGLNGCDSTVTLNLTINDSYLGSVDITSCDEFTWDGIVYDSTGSFTNVYTGLNGCDSTVTLNLTINNSPVVEIIFNNGILTANNITGSLAPYSYVWNTGEITQTITPANNGTYWVVVTDDAGCVSDTAVYILTNVSINDIDEVGFIVYPNPVSTDLNIEFNIMGNVNADLRIVNILGEVMYSEKIDNTSLTYSNTFDFTKFSNGIYFVKLKVDNKLITHKVIVQ